MSIELVAVFGVRHLSPGAAWHVRQFLDVQRPTIVLVEGIADATPLIPDLLAKGSRPPIAILAYTDVLPIRSLITPFAIYSPEYQALLWAKEQQVEARFIDLPASCFLALEGRNDTGIALGEDEPDPEETQDKIVPSATQAYSLYDRIAQQAGEPDYETWWERCFEHNHQPDSYRHMAEAFGQHLQEISAGETKENLLREAHMRRIIAQAVAEGHTRIAVIVGAAHVPGLRSGLAPMDDATFSALPQVSSQLTLMPYSYFKLSSQSGYGAGNHAPAYFEMMWQCYQTDPRQLATSYLTALVQSMREQGYSRSAAETIEAVRLAEGLAALHRGSAPTLRDLHSAATTIFGQGEFAVVAEALARVDVGTAIGHLTSGVSQTSIQADFQLQLETLKLQDYRSPVAKSLRLDLRENRRVKSEVAAFLDLRRSVFLHRLVALSIPFAKKQIASQQIWAEDWDLQWTPEAEIALVEAVLLGERIDVATAYTLSKQLDTTTSIDTATSVVYQAYICDLPSLIEQTHAKVQALAVESSAFTALAHAAVNLGHILRFGDLRRVDTQPLEPLLQQLCLQASLQLTTAALCDNDTAHTVLEAMGNLDALAQEHHMLVDEVLWLHALQTLSDRDDRNPLLSGYACALLCERGCIDDEQLAREVSRRLSPGIEADLGAGWFEGLAKRNRYALLSRLTLWHQLDIYISSLDSEQFPRALVFLRRAFAEFSPHERRSIAENLGEIWNLGASHTSEIMHTELNEDEMKQLDELNDFDFDDL